MTMDRRAFVARIGRWAALVPFVGAAASPSGQQIEGEIVAVEGEAPIVAYGPLGAHTEDYGLWIGNRLVDRGHFADIVERGQRIAAALWP